MFILCPVLSTSVSDSRSLIHINLNQVISVFKRGEYYHVTMSNGADYTITKSSYQLLMGLSGELKPNREDLQAELINAID